MQFSRWENQLAMRTPCENISNKFSKKNRRKKGPESTNKSSIFCYDFFFFFQVGIITLLPNYVQFSSATQSSLNLCDPTDCSTPGFPVPHQLPELVQTYFHESVMPSNHLILCVPFSSRLQSFPASGSFPMSQFTSGGQSIGASTHLTQLPSYLSIWII